MKFRRLMAKSLYPLHATPTSERRRLTIELTDAQIAEVQLIADLWNAFDRVRGAKRSRKWEVKSVLEQLTIGSMEEFWEQVGGRPSTGAMRESAIKAAIAELESKFPETK